LNHHLLKIIWNVTNKCGYDCKICATYSDRDELNLDKKNEVLNSILSIGVQSISKIDFAGGDPLFEIGSIQTIHNAINILGKNKISVTTTGKGINNIIKLGEDLSKLLYNCEITIDYLDNIPNYIRNDNSYIVTNKNILKYIINNITNLTINVPILNPKMNNDNIYKLVDAIEEINATNISVNLIRLMNVGRMNFHTYSTLYSPEHFVKVFIEYAKNTHIKNVHIQCALRGKICGTQCNMLNDKIGIDCSGNVFACAWGAYIKDFDKKNIHENPFYIGNLLEKTLLEILEDKRTTLLKQSIKNNPTNQCRVYCYENSDNCNIFNNIDPLFSIDK